MIKANVTGVVRERTGEQHVWYVNPGFNVVEAEFTDAINGDSVRGYGIVNRLTGIIECEQRRLDVAKIVADSFYKLHLDLIAQEEAAAAAPAAPTLPPISKLN